MPQIPDEAVKIGVSIDYAIKNVGIRFRLSCDSAPYRSRNENKLKKFRHRYVESILPRVRSDADPGSCRGNTWITDRSQVFAFNVVLTDSGLNLMVLVRQMDKASCNAFIGGSVSQRHCCHLSGRIPGIPWFRGAVFRRWYCYDFCKYKQKSPNYCILRV